MSPKTGLFYAILVLILALYACVDQIDLPATSLDGPKLVVQGQLVTGDYRYVEVTLDRAADFSVGSLPQPVLGARVRLVTETNEQVDLFEIAPGTHFLSGPDLTLPISYGTQYRVEIDLADGLQYQSQWETLLPAPQPDSMSIEIVSREVLNRDDQREIKDFVRFSIYTPAAIDQSPSFLKWDLESIYRLDETPPPDGVPGPGPATCYISRDLSLEEVLVFNGNESSNGRVDGFFLTEEEIDSRFALGFLLNVTQQSLTAAAFEYWDQVSKTVGLSGGLFEPTPGTINGNIINISDPEEEVFGFFYVTERQLVQRFVDPDTAGRPTGACGASGLNAGSLTCNNCLSIPRSTTVIPDGWGP